MLRKESNCIIVGNKVYLYTDDDNEELGLKKIGSGTEADVYVYNSDMLIKIYKKELLEENPEIYNEDRILEIADKKRCIKKSKLTYGPVFINGDFRGCALYYHKYAPSFNFIGFLPYNNYKFNRINDVLDELDEFAKNNMYYVDLTPNNILVPKLQKSALIDADGKSIKISPVDKEYCSKKMYGDFFDLMLETVFGMHYKEIEEYKDNDEFDVLIDSIFDEYHMSKEFREEFKNELFSYETLKDFALYLKQDKILKRDFR